MKYILFNILFLTISIDCVIAQNWDTLYRINRYDDARSVIETYDKGIVVPIYHVAESDFFELRKLDANGNTLWNKKYRFSNGNIFAFIRINKLERGGYLISGMTTTKDVNGDPFIVKLNECFAPEWQVIYHDEESSYNFVNSVIEIPSSNNLFLDIEGFKFGHKTLFKVNSVGDSVLSHKTFSDDLEFGKFHLIENYLYYLGNVDLALRNDPLLKQNKSVIFKLDTSNTSVDWAKVYRLNDSSDLSRYHASVQHSKEMFLAGYNNRSSPNSKDNRIKNSFYLRKVDTSGFTLWHKLLGDTTKNEAATHVLQLNNNKYSIYCQYSHVPEITNQAYGKMYVVDSNGTLLHKNIVDYREINQSTSGHSLIQSMIKTFDGKILTVGQTLTTHFANDFDVYCKKYNSDLTLAKRDAPNFTYDSLCALPVKDSIYILPTPKVLSFNKDFFEFDTLAYSEGKVLSVKPIKSIPKINCSIYPNPTNNGILVSIENFENFNSKLNYSLTNQLGQIVLKNKIDMPNTFIDLTGKASGIYYLNLSDKKGITLSSYKIIKE